MTKYLASFRTFIVLLTVMALIGNACNFLSRIVETPQPTEVIQPEVTAVTPGIEPTETEEKPALPTETPQVKYSVDPLIVFARYEEPKVRLEPAPTVADSPPTMDQVYNPFFLSEEQQQKLMSDGFVVSPGMEKEFFSLYEKARYANLPIFVTSDTLLHSYHLMFDKILRTAEVEHFIPLLRDLNRSLLQTLDEQYQVLQSTPWEEASRRAVAYLGVGSRLLDPTVQVPAYAADMVESEIALIEAAAGIMPSVIFPNYTYGEDYSQYIPRGHYTKSEELKAYFKSMMWYGRMTFRLIGDNPEFGRAETRSALLLVYAVLNTQVYGKPAVEAWADLYSPTVFFVGRSDDLNLLQYRDVIAAVYGDNPALTVLADDDRLAQFINLANQLPAPMILGMVILDTEEEEPYTKGLRLMGQRFVPDAYIFRQLIYDNVGTRENRRGLPKGLDLFAAMGSERAYELLDQMGDTGFENYTQQMEKIQQWVGNLSVEEWTETLYNTWIYSFYPLIEVPGSAYPFFMQSQSWLDKQLNTALGSWAELKHDTILYAKQVYAELGGGPPPPSPVPPRGYVEPVPLFYARLGALTTMTLKGLELRGLLNEQDKASLERLGKLAGDFKGMAEKELSGQPLTEDEYHLIRFYGGELEHFVMASADSDVEDPFAPKFMEEEPQAAVIADVATDPGSPQGLVVLEVGVGRINEIHVIVPIFEPDGSVFWQVAKGGVFSYHEFVWPGDDRLTDEKWRGMLEEGSAPPSPEWSGSFSVSQGEFSDQRLAIFHFQELATYAFWYIDSQIESTEPVLGVFQAELQELRAQGRYLAHQLVSTDFRSFDLQSEELAVVTVRETWQDQLYIGAFPEPGVEPVAERGPYTVEVTYTVNFDPEGNRWQVASVSFATSPPDWVFK